jgi:hypothetical protein
MSVLPDPVMVALGDVKLGMDIIPPLFDENCRVKPASALVENTSKLIALFKMYFVIYLFFETVNDGVALLTTMVPSMNPAKKLPDAA